MNELQSTLDYRKNILSVSASILAQSGIITSLYCIRTITKIHVMCGQLPYAQAAPLRGLFEFVTPKAGIDGSSVVRTPSGMRTEPCCIGSGSISTLKIGNKQSSTSRKDSALRIWVGGPSMLVGSTIGLQSCSGFMGLIRTARPQP